MLDGAKGLVHRLRAWVSETVEAWRDYPLREGVSIGGRYRIDRFIGMGSYGVAYSAVDTVSGRRVLVKTNKPSKGRLGVRLLRREREVMQRLGHPQIPALLDYVRLGRREALVAELIEGMNLEDCIHEEGAAYSESDTLKLVRRLAEPLHCLHSAGYVHRDVRIPNVIVEGDRVVLVDFGLACRIGERLPDSLRAELGETDVPHAAGTRGPQSSSSWDAVKRRMRVPEPASDLYGIGHLMLFLLYAGYEAPDERERSWQEELSLSPGLRDLIERLLAGELRDAAVLAAEADRLLGDSPSM